jgi:hypothetical protein
VKEVRKVFKPHHHNVEQNCKKKIDAMSIVNGAGFRYLGIIVTIYEYIHGECPSH